MSKHSVTWLSVATLIVALGTVGAAQAASVVPVVVEGNPTCSDLGYSFGFKIDPPSGGTYTFPDGVNTVVVTSDGTYFDFESTLSVDAVIVKGGDRANVYAYDPEVFADQDLRAPDNASGGPAGLSHIDFCYDYEVAVTKTAETSYTRTYSWTIDKAVAPTSIAMFTGDSATATYTVTVTRSAEDSDWAAHGEITIDNPSPFPATVTDVADVVSGGFVASVDCGDFSGVIPAWGTVTCTYEVALEDGADRTNTATVTTEGVVGGGSGSAAVTFGEPTTIEGSEEVDVTDTNGGSEHFADSGTWTYTRTFSCDNDEGLHLNTAKITQTEQKDSATVNVACYALSVVKDANTSFDRDHHWTLDKDANYSTLVLAVGQQIDVTYTVSADQTNEDSDWAVEGDIKITNPAPFDATLTGVTDEVSGTPPFAAAVTCPALMVPAGGSLTCHYWASLPDAQPRTNTATATLQNTPSGTTDFSGSASVDFAGATIDQSHECIEVSDTFFPGEQVEVCAGDAPWTYSYTRTIGPYSECGSYSVVNTASFTGAPGEPARYTIDVSVPCDPGCTLTQGYWKTHSAYGPAPYDDTWAQIGEDTLFFLSGQSYYDVMWTTPKGGNAYYILAHQYIAAQLNGLNGAPLPDPVADAFSAATDLFLDYSPDDFDSLKGKKGTEARALFLGYATILDEYNNGLSGPPHCSE